MDLTKEALGVAPAAKYLGSSDVQAPETVSGPAKESERILALDTLRGVAALGILAMNIQYFSQVTAAYSNPTLTGSFTGFDFWLWLLSRVFFDEKMMAIFSMLYGAGIVLLTSRIEATGAGSFPIFLRRSFWLLIFGLLHAYLLWSGDILFSYAVCGMLVYPFRKWPARRLLVMGVLLLSVSSLIYLGYGWSMKSWPPDKIQVIEQQIWRPSPQQIATQVAAYRGSWLSQMSQRVPEAELLQVQAFLYLTLWRAGGLMLIGMALYRLRLLTGDLKISTYRNLGIIGCAIAIPIILYGVNRDIAENWDFRYAFFIGSQFNYWGSLGVALGWICLVMIACRTPSLRSWCRRFAAVGKMAFSNYIFETIVCTAIFYGHGLGQFGRLSRLGGVGIVLAIWLAIFALSKVWMDHFYSGPLEWLWRSLTYKKLQTFRRTTGVPEPA